MSNGWSQEIQLLLLCARTRVSAEVAEQIQHLCAQDLDWRWLAEAAREQGILPLVTGSLTHHSAEILPVETLALMRQGAQRVALRNLFLTHELLALLKTFQSAQISALPFKGPILAYLAYGNVALRQFIDLDILIPRHQIRQAKQLLLEGGFESRLVMSAAEEEDFLDTQLGYDFRHPGKKLSVELHWNLLQRWLSYPSRIEDLWEDPLPVEISGTAVYTLALHHLLPYLCAHATKHGWGKLKWLCDVAELIQSCPELDWDRVMAEAEALRSVRMVLLGLELIHKHFGVSSPKQIQRLIQQDAMIPTLVSTVEKQLFGQPFSHGSWREHLFFLRSREHVQDRWVYLLYLGQLTLQPSTSDRDWLPLPDSLEFLYLLLRPFRILIQFILGQRVRSSK